MVLKDKWGTRIGFHLTRVVLSFRGYFYYLRLVSDRHHFDNPAYGNSSNGGGSNAYSTVGGGGVLPIHGSPMPMAAVAVASGDDHIHITLHY